MPSSLTPARRGPAWWACVLLLACGLGAAQANSSAKLGSAPEAAEPLVDINSASRQQLQTLPGIGSAEADRIVACRPYLSKAELVTKQVMPTGPFLTLKHRVIALQKGDPKVAAARSARRCG